MNDKGKGQMQQGDIILGFLAPADENATEAVHPTMGAFHHPAPRLGPGLPLDLLGFLAPRTDVRGETELLHDLSHFVVVIAPCPSTSLAAARRWAGDDWRRPECSPALAASASYRCGWRRPRTSRRGCR